MKTLAEVMDQATQSEAFDAILKEAARNAVSQGFDTTGWKQLMNFFAENPAELDELSNPIGIASLQRKMDAFRTTLTYTSAGCPTIGDFSGEGAAAASVKSAKRAERSSRSVASAKQPRRPTKKAS